MFTLVKVILMFRMANRRKKPREISHDNFAGVDKLSVNDLKRVVVASLHNAAASLIPDYQDTPIVLVALQLGLDNSKVLNATLSVQGFCEVDQKKVEKLFPTEAQFFLAIERLDLLKFKFENAMASSLLSSKDIPHKFKNADGSLVSDELVNDACISGWSGCPFLTLPSFYRSSKATGCQ